MLDKKRLKDRSETMLTVEVLIEWLKTQDPKACILGFETNSNAYIEQFREIPNQYISTVKDAKVREREHLMNWYRNTDPTTKGFKTIDELVDHEINEIFRYAKDTDIVSNI